MIIVMSLFLKRSVYVFSFTLKRKAGVFKFLRFEERFRKVPFSRVRDGLVWMVGLTVEIKLRFQICTTECRRGLSYPTPMVGFVNTKHRRCLHCFLKAGLSCSRI